MTSALAWRLARQQARHYRSLADTIATLDENSKDDFTFAVQAVLQFTDMTPAHMGDGVGIGEWVIDRWARGKFTHYAVVSRTVRNWLVRDLRERADMLEAFPDELGRPKDDYVPSRYIPHVISLG
jgi:hypothetical protein